MGRKLAFGPLVVMVMVAITSIAGCQGAESEPEEEPRLLHAPLRGELPCDPCAIELEPVAVIPDTFNAVALEERGLLRRDRMGRIHMSTWGRREFAVFGEDGSLLAVRGGGGDGPGEFGIAIPPFSDPFDTLWAWDPFLRRATVYTPDLEFVRTVRLPLAPSRFLPDGSILAIQVSRERELIGQPTHVISRDGDVLKSFGRDPPAFRPDRPAHYTNAGGLTEDGLVWMSPQARYELQLWDPREGTLLQDHRPEAPWFEEIEAPGDFRVDYPGSVIRDIWSDSMGVVWVLFQTAAEDWTACCPDGSPISHGPVSLETITTYLDWILQAVHPETGEVIAERRLHDWTDTTFAGGDIYTIDIDPATGAATYRVWRPTLSPTTGR